MPRWTLALVLAVSVCGCVWLCVCVLLPLPTSRIAVLLLPFHLMDGRGMRRNASLPSLTFAFCCGCRPQATMTLNSATPRPRCAGASGRIHDALYCSHAEMLG